MSRDLSLRDLLSQFGRLDHVQVHVGILGNLSDDEIAGYYVFSYPVVISIDFTLDRSALKPLVNLFLKREIITNNFQTYASIADFLEKLPEQLSHEEPNSFRRYIIPHKKGETFEEATIRIVSTKELIKKFGIAKKMDRRFASIQWFEQPIVRLPEDYVVLDDTISQEVWLRTVRNSNFMNLAVEHGPYPVTQPRKLKYTKLLKNIPDAPEALPYRKQGVVSMMPTKKLEQKVSRHRGVEFTYYQNVLIPSFWHAYLNNKLPKSKFPLETKLRRYMDIDSDITIGTRRLQELPTTVLQPMLSSDHKKIAIGKIPGMPGLAVFVTGFIKCDERICLYSGEYRDHLEPADKSVHYSFKTVLESVTVLSHNQAIYAYRRGNFASFINYAPSESKDPKQATANCGAALFNYQNVGLICYTAARDIKPGEQLLADYSDSAGITDLCSFAFTQEGTILANNSAKNEATRVSEEGIALFTSKNYQDAKSVLKRALVLQQLFSNEEMVTKISYHLGLAYVQLMKMGDNKQAQYSAKSQQHLQVACKKELNFARQILFTQPQNAITHLKIALEVARLFPNDKQTLTQVCKSLGAAYLALSKNPSEKSAKFEKKSSKFFMEAKALADDLFVVSEKTNKL